MDESEYRVYMDLDSIFDIRHVILCKLYPDLAVEVTMNGDYQTRKKNIFKHPEYPIEVHSDVLDAYYKERNKGDLSLAGINSIPLVLSEFLNVEVETIKFGKETSNLVIYLNIYPYDLTEEEQHNICFMLRQFYERHVEFRCVRLQPHEVSPKWLVELEMKLVFIENLMLWFEANDNRQLGSHSLHDMRFVTPRFPSRISLGMKEEDWETLVKVLSLVTTVEFLDMKAYCALNILNLRAKENRVVKEHSTETK